MRRRDLLAALPAVWAGAAFAQTSDLATTLRRRALELSARPYRPPSKVLPRELAGLDYDGYRQLRFRPEMAVWRDEGLPFQLQMFHRGGLFRTAVELFEVEGGEVRPIGYRPEMFTSGKVAMPNDPALGFAGFRIHARINDPERFDEFAVFLGASYFRAVPKGAAYGLSARGIELGAGEPNEEFPAFQSFYIERPKVGDASIVVHALMDGPSVAGAYRFVITPGEETLFEVETSLYPRRTLKAGLAPLTSMYLYGSELPRRFDDFRPEVHDSDGLSVDGLWTPLSNPEKVRITSFPAERIFGLVQRQRTLDAYHDLEAHYHRRPNARVEPLGWAPGEARLVELPARSEGEDNMVASWRTAKPLAANREHRFAYRLHWTTDPAPVGGVVQWRTGAGDAPGRRRFIVEFAKLEAKGLKAELSTSAGKVLHPVVQRDGDSARLSFEFEPKGAADISARLVGEGVASETWLYRWRP